MTEAEWWVCENPKLMLEALQDQASERKLRLFACACCRHFWHLLIDQRSRTAVEVAERFSDGLLSDDEAQAAFASACEASLKVRSGPDHWPETVLRLRYQHSPETLWRAAFTAAFAVGSGVGDVVAHIRSNQGILVAHSLQAQFLRDIFGPLPSRSVSVSSRHLNPQIIVLAQSIYDDRAFDRLPVLADALADALEDAGCEANAILDHCRQPANHVRGCWAVDFLLGKE